MFAKKTLRDIDLKGKTVLLRADYNVPLSDGKITDDYRLRQSLPTVRYILKQASNLIICSHLGRPDGQFEAAYSLKPVAKRLSDLLDENVIFAEDCVGEVPTQALKTLKPGQVMLLENLRFHAEEKQNDSQFAKQLASLADVYVNDAFGVDHRADASVVGVTKYLPAAAGFLLEKEMDVLTDVMKQPKHPLMAIIGGAKIADKLDVMHQLLKIADCVAVGGAMANTFLVAQGVAVGGSLYSQDEVASAKAILKMAEAEAKQRQFVFIVPRDVVVAAKIDKTAPTRIVELTDQGMADVQYYPGRVPAAASQIYSREKILDIGPLSATFIAGMIQLANTVVWSGTMGVTETPALHGPIGPTAHGTQTVIEAMIGDFGHKPFSVVGGGDTVGYVQSRKLTEAFNHVSTGGSASLEVLAGHKLPGVEALPDQK
jgi:phosphoglycerate kinase